MSTASPASPTTPDGLRSKALAHRDAFIARHVGDSIEIAPVPVAAVRRGGHRPLRVLLFGGGPLIGTGLRDHELGLPGHVADALAARTRRGVEMDVIVDAEPARRSAVEGIQGLRLWRYDAIVAVLGRPAAKTSNQDHAYWVAELVRTLLVEGGPTSPLFVYDSAPTVTPAHSAWPGGADRRLQAQRDAAERACARTDRVRFAELDSPRRPPAEGRAFSAGQFEEWADTIVHRLLQQLEVLRSAPAALDAPTAHPDDERLRQRALDSLRMDRDGNPRLEQIIRTAKDRYQATGAALNIIDRDQQWSKVSVPVPLDMPRDQSICHHAIQIDGTTLINDTRLDERLTGNPLTEKVRFYAGHPIRTWDGFRIGELCIYGADPRKMRMSDLESLRDLAGLIEQELWSVALDPQQRR